MKYTVPMDDGLVAVCETSGDGPSCPTCGRALPYIPEVTMKVFRGEQLLCSGRYDGGAGPDAVKEVAERWVLEAGARSFGS